MQLSEHFHLDEFTRSQTASRLGIDMSVSTAVSDRLMWLCDNFLEPIREGLDYPLVITSGYRPPALNKAIGGSRSSAHMMGLAADFVAVNTSPLELYEFIKGMRFQTKFDQLIFEHTWVHLGVVTPPRGQVFTI